MAYSIILKRTPEELELLRSQLNAAGLYAYLSPIAALLFIFVLRQLPARGPKSEGASGSSLSRIADRLNTTYIREFGPLYVQVFGLAYGLWLAFLVFRGTSNDYMHLTKAFGHVVVSQLPWHYLLAVKNTTYSPISMATGLRYDRLNATHRLFGRIIHVFLATHAVLYLKAFVDMGVLQQRLSNRVVQLGIFTFWAFNFLGILAVPPLRKGARSLFWRSHVILSAAVLPALWFHVPYTRWYIGQAAVLYFVNILGRTRGASKTQ
jgi:hypothetical protein